LRRIQRRKKKEEEKTQKFGGIRNDDKLSPPPFFLGPKGALSFLENFALLKKAEFENIPLEARVFCIPHYVIMRVTTSCWFEMEV